MNLYRSITFQRLRTTAYCAPTHQKHLIVNLPEASLGVLGLVRTSPARSSTSGALSGSKTTTIGSQKTLGKNESRSRQWSQNLLSAQVAQLSKCRSAVFFQRRHFNNGRTRRFARLAVTLIFQWGKLHLLSFYVITNLGSMPFQRSAVGIPASAM